MKQSLARPASMPQTSGGPRYDHPAIVASDVEQGGSPILFEDEGMRGSFTQVPNAILQRSDLSHSARLTYIHLLHFAWQKETCFPGQERLAHDLNVSVRSVGEYLRELQEHGLIRIQRRGLGKTNIYHICRLAQVQHAAAIDDRADHAPSNVRTFAAHRQPAGRPATLASLVLPQGGSTPVACFTLERQDSTDVETQSLAHADLHLASDQDGHSATDKNTRIPKKPAPKIPRKTDTKHGAAAIAQSPGTIKTEVTVVVPAGLSEIEHKASQALRRWGIVTPRIVAQLCTADPQEVLYQAECLALALADGAVISNPAGWLLRAIEGRYRGMSDCAMSDGHGTSASETPSIPEDAAAANRASQTQPISAAQTTDVSGHHDVWALIQAEIAATMPASAYQRWFAATSLVRYSETLDGRVTLLIGATSNNHCIYLAERVVDRLHMAVRSVLGRDAGLEFIVCDNKGE